MTLTGEQANFLLDVAFAHMPSGVPTPYTDDKDAIAQGLERAGLVVRHHVGKGKGAALTNEGRYVLSVITKS
jgi:hypothetical protein